MMSTTKQMDKVSFGGSSAGESLSTAPGAQQMALHLLSGHLLADQKPRLKTNPGTTPHGVFLDLLRTERSQMQTHRLNRIGISTCWRPILIGSAPVMEPPSWEKSLSLQTPKGSAVTSKPRPKKMSRTTVGMGLRFA